MHCICRGRPEYLVEKGRFPAALVDQLLAELRRPKPELVVAPLDLLAAERLRTIVPTIRDMPDRMIFATAVALGVPLATRDRQLVASGIPTFWYPFGKGGQEVGVSQRLIMNYLTAKRLLGALQMTLQRHHKAFGSLKIDDAGRTLITMHGRSPPVRQPPYFKAENLLLSVATSRAD